MSQFVESEMPDRGGAGSRQHVALEAVAVLNHKPKGSRNNCQPQSLTVEVSRLVDGKGAWFLLRSQKSYEP